MNTSRLAFALVLGGAMLAALPAADAAPRPMVFGKQTPKLHASAAPIAPSSRLIFLRRCGDAGCPITAGNADDSRSDTSQIARFPSVVIGRFSQSDAVWKQVVTCVRATYAPFDISVTDVDPGNVPHYEHIVGGHPQDLADGIDDAGGVSPATCEDLPNAMTYTFDVWGGNSNVICSVVAQETAHAFGLEHELLANDPMTYLAGPYPKRFQAQAVSCGEYQARTCDCHPSQPQNSYQYLVDMFGPGVATPPTVSINTPASGTTVTPRFIARIDAEDDVAVEHVELTIDGLLVGMTATKPYKIQVPDGIEEGPHTIMATAFDVQGTPAVSDSLDIVMGPPCTAAAGCEGTDVCVSGLCVAGPDAPGGLGDFCQGNTECLSGSCVADSSGDRACVEPCDQTAPGSCPSGFSCIAAGGGGVCWAEASGGCCDAGRGNPLGAMMLGLGIVVLIVVPRRPRRRSR